MTNCENLLSPKDAAKKLQRSAHWVREAIRRRRIDYVKIGGRYYIPEKEIERFFVYVPSRENELTKMG